MGYSLSKYPSKWNVNTLIRYQRSTERAKVEKNEGDKMKIEKYMYLCSRENVCSINLLKYI